MDKRIKYTERDFESIKQELIEFSKKYYPELSDNFNDSSVGSWIIDLVASVGDNLNYHLDRVYQETDINSANSKSAMLNIARTQGIKVPGRKNSLCEVELTCELTVGNDRGPNWNVAPLIKRGSVVGNNTYQFELLEDVNFAEQFNDEGLSNRTFVPKRNNNGNIEKYIVTKTALVGGGTSKVYKKVISDEELTPFMEVILPEKGISNIESIIFKESGNLSFDPQTFEYFIDAEEFKVSGCDIKTYRYFEVDSLCDQYRFGKVVNMNDDGLVEDVTHPYVFTNVTETTEDGASSKRTSRYYQGKWQSITQKFITEYTDNGYLKIIFGPATENVHIPEGVTSYGAAYMSKVINNDMMGVLPKAGWTMFVRYRTGGGASTNLAPGAINSVMRLNVHFPDKGDSVADLQGQIIKSIKVYNRVPSLGGKDEPSAAELRYLLKYAIAAQERCVTIKDYKAKLMSIPAQYGCPFRCNVAEDNNKVSMSVLHLNNDGKLTTYLPQPMAENIVEYLSHYKNLTDYIEVRSGRIYNLGFIIDIFVDKSYTTADVVASVINKVKEYMDINAHEMGEDIFIGDLEREINAMDGVISLINLEVHNVYDGIHSHDKCPLPSTDDNPWCYNPTDNPTVSEEWNGEGSKHFKIDLNAIDHVLYSDIDSQFEVKYPENDIKIRVKLR